MARRRRNFTQEFKAEAVDLVQSSDKPITHVARDIGVSASGLRNWVRQAEIDKRNDPSGALTTSEREEFVRVKRELRQAKMERDFLKKAAAFFAKENS